MVKKKCAIIGSGLGGLAAAIRLSVMGFEVDVYEKNSCPGGKADQILENGFRFDSGPSVLTMPFVLEELFQSAGVHINDFIKLKKLEINCKYFYDDKTIINAYSDQKEFINELVNKTSEQEENILKLFNQTKNIYELTAPIFLFNKLWEPKEIFNKKSLKLFMKLNKPDLMRTMHESNSKYLTDPKVIQLFDRYATYNGSNPYSAPSVLNVISHVENLIGAFVPKKGIHSITEALYELALKLNVKFYFDQDVTKIIISNNSVEGIQINNEKIEYDFVVSNADVNFTSKNLLGISDAQSKYDHDLKEPSSSAIVFYWGIKGSHKELEIHNILFSSDYKKEFDDIFIKKIIPDDPTIYIYCSSKFNNDDAPAGYENWFVMINTPYNSGQNWEDETEKLKEKVIIKIKKILGIDLTQKIVFENTLTPKCIEEKTNSLKGSIYGMSSNSKYSAFFRKKNISSKFNHLYFVGGSVHPGGGIPLVLLSAKIASGLIYKRELN